MDDSAIRRAPNSAQVPCIKPFLDDIRSFEAGGDDQTSRRGDEGDAASVRAGASFHARCQAETGGSDGDEG